MPKKEDVDGGELYVLEKNQDILEICPLGRSIWEMADEESLWIDCCRFLLFGTESKNNKST
jgi:hypothetical protein